MFTGIDPRASTPLYLQIAESVKRSIASGEAVPGDVLPTVRALATRLRVNPAAVQQAYRELVREGIAIADGEGSQQVVRLARPTEVPARAREMTTSGARREHAARREELAHLEPGSMVEDRFRVKQLLGSGAMGAVYLVRDLELDEDVALKVLPPFATDDETAVKRFINEIRIARRISHRNVVRTHDVGRWSGGLFLTMEYVAGRTVRDLLDARGTLPPREAAQLVLQLVAALTVAHAEGIIHRDVKPQNLLIDGAGTLKVLDFGIAVMQGRSGQLTEAGLVVGTPAYMAPEQLMGEALAPAADLYATGVVLYEMLCGKLPFPMISPMALIAHIVQHGPVPLDAVSPTTPKALADLVMRMLSRDQSARPTSPEVASALNSVS